MSSRGAALQEEAGKQPGQLGALEKLGRGKGKMQAAQAPPSTAPGVGPLLMLSYMDERAKRLLYADRGLHVLVRCEPHERSSGTVRLPFRHNCWGLACAQG